ncbi:MAG TPA: PEGA domain-containing protein [Vicinamibacterales bacterium]
MGAGTLGPVFRAYDARRERLVAVKLFRLDLPPERVHQLVAELEELIAAELNHPAVAIPLATGFTGVSAYLAQDYVAAESLDLAVREYGAAPAADALRVAVQLAGALDLAAVANVNHGALHPRDVLLSDDETRLTGIGVARALENVGIAPPVRRPYTAPERRSSGPWGRQSDVFSLAALVHELLWGRRLAAEGSEAADSLSDLPNARMRVLRGAFARALAEKPEDRYDSALEFAEALKDAFPDVQLAEPVPPKKKQAQRKKAASMLPLEDTEPVQAPEVAAPRHIASPVEEVTVESSGAAARTDLLVDVEPPALAEPLGRLEPLARFEPLAPPLEPLAPAELLAPLERPEFLEPPEPPEPHEPRVSVTSPPVFSSAAVIEQTRSAVWPLMAALVIGLAIGFAGGYGIGTTRDHTTPVLTEAQSSPSPATPGRDATEIAVTPSPGASAPGAPAPRAQQPRTAPRPEQGSNMTADRRSTPAPDRRAAARPEPERSTSRPRPPAPVPAGTSGQFVGRLSVDSRPVGARVFLDNKQIGLTPLAMPSIRAGEHAIRLERDGYRHWTSTVRVVAGEQNRVTASLDR